MSRGKNASFFGFAQGKNLFETIILLVVEDLGQELVLDVIELLQGGLQGGLIFAGGLMEVPAELVGGVMHQHFGTLKAFGVAGEAEMDELGVVLYLLESCTGLIDVTIEHLSACDFGHGVDEFRVEETLLAGLSLLSLKLEAVEGLGVGKVLVDRRCVDRHAEGEKKRQRKKKSRGPIS
jgi:hypothetical protein